jgi:tetratricopeptide (TPR) repeat protein
VRSSSDRFLAILGMAIASFLAAASAADGIKLDASGPDERLRIEARVNGHPVGVALDTGLDCGYLLFRSDLPQLGLGVPEPAGTSFAPGKYPFILAQSCTWSLLGTTLPKLHPLVLTVPLRFLREEAGLVGLVGWPAVRKNIWVLNLAAGRIGTAKSVPAPALHWDPFQIKSDLRILSLVEDSPSNGRPLPRLLIDTGNADGILLPADQWRAWRAAHPGLPTTISADWMVGQGERAEEQVWAETFTLGNLVLHDVPVQEEDEAYTNMSPGEPVIALGLAALQRLDVVLDGPHHAAYLRASDAPAPAFQHNRLGVAFLSADARNSPQVATRIIPGSPAAVAGILPGDVLVEVDGKPATRESYWKKPAGTKYALILKRGEFLVPVDVVLQDLVGPKLPPGPVAGKGIVAFRPRAVVLDRVDDGYFLVTGLARAAQGDYAGAIASYTQAIAISPKFAAAYCARAESRVAQGDLADAVADLNQAIALNPGYAEAYDNRGLTENAVGDLADAVADYDRAIEFNPKAGDAYNHRGEAEEKEGKFDEALADFDRAVALDPAYAPAYSNRGAVRELRGDFAGALADCDRAIALNPNDAEAFSNRGAARAGAGQFAAAAADFDQAIALNPRSVSAYENRGASENDAGDYAGAIADYSRAIALHPQDGAAYRGRALAKDASGDSIGALADYSNSSPPANRTDLFLRFRISLVLRRLNMDEADGDLIEAVDAAEPGWAKTIGSYLIGTLSEAELIAAAASATEETRADRECEADYYMAMMHLLRDETSAARALLAKCVATRASANEEFTLAKGELARLAPASS